MGAQDLMNGITSSVTESILTAGKIKEGFDKEAEAKITSKSAVGIDAKMAAKARKVAQEKINAIYANKELSKKARTQKMGKVIDEYNKATTVGGKK